MKTQNPKKKPIERLCPKCNKIMRFLGNNHRGLRPDETIDYFCENCCKIYFIRISLDDIVEIKQLSKEGKG